LKPKRMLSLARYERGPNWSEPFRLADLMSTIRNPSRIKDIKAARTALEICVHFGSALPSNFQKPFGIESRFRAHMLHLRLPIIAQEIEPQTVLVRFYFRNQ